LLFITLATQSGNFRIHPRTSQYDTNRNYVRCLYRPSEYFSLLRAF